MCCGNMHGDAAKEVVSHGNKGAKHIGHSKMEPTGAKPGVMCPPQHGKAKTAERKPVATGVVTACVHHSQRRHPSKQPVWACPTQQAACLG